ncbi:MAG: hypothetical protein HOI34_08420 [Rhodospirillaceae bacterium]|jgi:multiple antibiotic resistance protein|nr:hypothetical protein [Rhodospirillaceae bacterium]MBT6203711.1 hypothetical protein [Rhodospirillaceae bacterium]MBT6512462.1 hypothetical protein [Rhodospirillaceae bacterium]MBT7614453.1 hypothetical protein [Rhodospirillaceae bacterium]
MTKVILESQDNEGLTGNITIIGTIFIVLIVLIVAGLVHWMAEPIGKCLGKSGLTIMTRLFGLVVVAIGVEVIVRGICDHLDNFGFVAH